MIFLTMLLIMLLIDAYCYKGILVLFRRLKHRWIKTLIYSVFWISAGLMIAAMLMGYFFRSTTRNPHVFTWYYYLFGAFVVFYIPKMVFVVFHLLEDIVFGFYFVLKKITGPRKVVDENGQPITRLKFLSQTGLILASIPFFSFLWGMVRGRFDFRVEHVSLGFNHLPEAFNGLKIVQISDIHIGSFEGFHKKVEEAVGMINAQKADILLFSGDLFNNFAEEMEGWFPILSRMEAKYGKFACLGNHDYGKYYHWKTEEEQQANFRKMKEAYQQIGFTLLNNESHIMQRETDKIAIIGVENWGHPPFPQYGDYDKASETVSKIPFKILLSHDPTHWDEKIQGKTDVALTLSGHTHGMQFGINLGNIKWSPAKYKYPRWAGLYNVGRQFLYVNRGFGYIGYPGRVGMPPEITVITLQTA